jgi:glycerol-3-phosphate dehydrogenase
MDAAADIYAHLPRQRFAAPRINGVHHEPPGAIEQMSFPGLNDPVPTVGWTVEHEFCHTLADYLRRRTNIAQWVARQGLGRGDENIAQIRRIALELSQGDVQAADRELDRYRALVRENFDQVLGVA